MPQGRCWSNSRAATAAATTPTSKIQHFKRFRYMIREELYTLCTYRRTHTRREQAREHRVGCMMCSKLYDCGKRFSSFNHITCITQQNEMAGGWDSWKEKRLIVTHTRTRARRKENTHTHIEYTGTQSLCYAGQQIKENPIYFVWYKNVKKENSRKCIIEKTRTHTHSYPAPASLTPYVEYHTSHLCDIFLHF